MKTERPLPQPSPVSRVFWEKAAQGELWLQKCQHCQRFIFYPRAVCPGCLGEELEWQPVSGRGRVYSFTVVHRTDLPGFADELPYVYAIIELEEGPRMISNVTGCPVDQVSIGMPVQVSFEEVAEGIRLPRFRPLPAR
ncbi:MAG: Zn-ribbon domain-containing OB-fold protein [Syntrophomonadaceae bacterium]|jgi:uncharacterized OB-fold protein|nr:Zn-ribbon domain-containing OB-fold protein [Syntrophomonadaceae bacterium]MDH7498362.1 Zn-ribbon domain-containing OB-fold protein [Syntrophomonadaceae bacterium]